MRPPPTLRSIPTTDWPTLPLPAPEGLACDEFLLRTWRLGDARALAAAWDDDEIVRWLEPPSAALSVAANWIEGEEQRRKAGTALDLVIEVGGVVAGEVGFSSFDRQGRVALVGYWVAKTHRGDTLASRALAVAATWLAEASGVVGLLAECDPANDASWRTAETAGFRRLPRPGDGRHVYYLDL
jgi:ribosomal-protein-alanine N-acetyltransferase